MITAVRTDTNTVHLLRTEQSVTTLCGQPMLMVGRWMFGDDDNTEILQAFGARPCGTCRRISR